MITPSTSKLATRRPEPSTLKKRGEWMRCWPNVRSSLLNVTGEQTCSAWLMSDVLRTPPGSVWWKAVPWRHPLPSSCCLRMSWGVHQRSPQALSPLSSPHSEDIIAKRGLNGQFLWKRKRPYSSYWLRSHTYNILPLTRLLFLNVLKYSINKSDSPRNISS